MEGETEMPLFLEHNLGDLDTSKVSNDDPLIPVPMLNVAALRVDMLGEIDYHLALAGGIVDVDNFHKHLLQLLGAVS